MSSSARNPSIVWDRVLIYAKPNGRFVVCSRDDLAYKIRKEELPTFMVQRSLTDEERLIEHPVRFGPAAKRGTICLFGRVDVDCSLTAIQTCLLTLNDELEAGASYASLVGKYRSLVQRGFLLQLASWDEPQAAEGDFDHLLMVATSRPLPDPLRVAAAGGSSAVTGALRQLLALPADDDDGLSHPMDLIAGLSKYLCFTHSGTIGRVSNDNLVAKLSFS
jgi:hypothetical protein